MTCPLSSHFSTILHVVTWPCPAARESGGESSFPVPCGQQRTREEVRMDPGDNEQLLPWKGLRRPLWWTFDVFLTAPVGQER